MKRIIITAMMAVFMILASGQEKQSVPEGAVQAVQNEWPLIVDLMRINEKQFFSHGSPEDCTLSSGQLIMKVSLYRLLEGVMDLDSLIITSEENNYLFATMLENEGIMMVNVNEVNGQYFVGAGGSAKGYIQAEQLLRKLLKDTEDSHYDVYQTSFGSFIMIYDNKVIPFDQSANGLLEQYLKVTDIRQLPSIEEYLKEAAKVIGEKADQVALLPDIVYDGDLSITLLPHSFSSASYVLTPVLLLVAVGATMTMLQRKRRLT